MKKIVLFTAVSTALLVSGASQAAIDLTTVTAGFTDLTTAITEVGTLILGAAVIAVAFKWVKGMIFS